MDYEKEYKDAMERAKKWGLTHKLCIEDIFPELRESEDERIRKELISMIKECTNWVHKKEYIAFLEKLKENPKSSDSIPPDCMSNAKYEDRWHKVTDSLPDNGREVLAKDKLGNTLLARYDGEGWDVSVYDYEDYRCHNGISKWCEIPSEKQKEETLRDFIDNFPYSVEQKEQKPAEWSDEDTEMYINVLSSLRGYACELENEEHKRHIKKELDWLENRFESLRPSWKPSENIDVNELAYERYPINNRLVREVTKDINEDARDGFIDGYKYCDSTRWKPSEEQMEVFTDSVYFLANHGFKDPKGMIESLWQDLKKLI